MGIVNKVMPDPEGRVRVVRVKVAKYKYGPLSNFGTYELERPIAKVILLRKNKNLNNSV